MKKIALTSLLAVFAVSAASAATINDNPLYLPGQGHFYSITTVGSHSGSAPIKEWKATEEFGYGVTKDLALMVRANAEENDTFETYGWQDLMLSGAYRFANNGAWKFDLIGAYGIDNVWPYHQPMLDKDLTGYAWTAGVRGGYMAKNWTVAGHAYFQYTNTESFNWNKDGRHAWLLGLDAQYMLDSHWSVLAGAEYTGYTDNGVKNAGEWEGKLGMNYNIDAAKYVGAYVSAEMDHRGGAAGDEWEVENGFGFGAKFGVEF